MTTFTAFKVRLADLESGDISPSMVASLLFSKYAYRIEPILVAKAQVGTGDESWYLLGAIHGFGWGSMGRKPTFVAS